LAKGRAPSDGLVRATLVKAYADVKGLSAEAAEKAVADLDRAHRYLADTY